MVFKEHSILLTRHTSNVFTTLTILLRFVGSDHASWAKAGYRSAFAIEGDFSDNST